MANPNEINDEQRRKAEADRLALESAAQAKGLTVEKAEQNAAADEAQRKLDAESAARTKADNEAKAKEAAAAEAKAKADAAAKTVEIKLLRDHWIGEDRHSAGANIEVTTKEARRLIDAGVASRTDPLPGE